MTNTGIKASPATRTWESFLPDAPGEQRTKLQTVGKPLLPFHVLRLEVGRFTTVVAPVTVVPIRMSCWKVRRLNEPSTQIPLLVFPQRLARTTGDGSPSVLEFTGLHHFVDFHSGM